MKKPRRTKSRPFIQLLKHVGNSDEYGQLSGSAVKLLIELHLQYNGHNNGDLCATWSQLRKRGFKSKGTLSRSLKELIATKFIVLSRISYQWQKPNLYAITYLSIDECNGKLDIKETVTAPNSWRTEIQLATPYEYLGTPHEYLQSGKT